MLYVTAQAIRTLAEQLEDKRAEPAQAYRLLRHAPDQFEFALDEPRAADQVEPPNGRPVLLVEPAVAEGVHGSMLDVTQGPDGLEIGIRLSETEEPTGWVPVPLRA